MGSKRPLLVSTLVAVTALVLVTIVLVVSSKRTESALSFALAEGHERVPHASKVLGGVLEEFIDLSQNQRLTKFIKHYFVI